MRNLYVIVIPAKAGFLPQEPSSIQRCGGLGCMAHLP